MAAYRGHWVRRRAWAVLATVSLALTACGGAQTATTAAAGDETISVFGAYATQIEEPPDSWPNRAETSSGVRISAGYFLSLLAGILPLWYPGMVTAGRIAGTYR